MALKKCLLLLAGLLFASTLCPSSDQSPRRIEIVAGRFSYEPDEITLKKGEPVTLVFHSKDVTHGIKIEEFKVNSEIKKGQNTEITVTPTEMGHFEGKCSHFCGKGHGSMRLHINVVE
jgi:cytochrome c oxidase subunit II